MCIRDRGYIEYRRVSDFKGDNSGVKYIERDGGTKPMMMPSGPVDHYGDFLGFMRNNPITTEDACLPAEIEVCKGGPDLSSIPPLNVTCGPAQDQTYTNISQINERDLCTNGIPARD